MPELPDAVKAAVAGSGLMPALKHALFPNAPRPGGEPVEALKGKAEAAIQDIEQRLSGGTLDDAALQKLGTALLRLQGALQQGAVSPEALAAALAEARSAINAADSSAKVQAVSQRMEQLWQQVEACNKEIDGDFEKMRQAGIRFDAKLWNRHQALSDYLLAHPQDIGQQKELDAVDDQLLHQAEPQLHHCPSAKPHYEHAKKKSEERHQEMEEINASKQIERQQNFTSTDWDDIQSENVTMNDVTAPVTRKQKPEAGKTSGMAK